MVQFSDTVSPIIDNGRRAQMVQYSDTVSPIIDNAWGEVAAVPGESCLHTKIAQGRGVGGIRVLHTSIN